MIPDTCLEPRSMLPTSNLLVVILLLVLVFLFRCPFHVYHFLDVRTANFLSSIDLCMSSFSPTNSLYLP